MAELAITFRCLPSLKAELEKEMELAGFKSLNKYVPALISNPKVVAIRTGKEVSAPSAGSIEDIKLKSEIEQLRKQNAELLAKLKKSETTPPPNPPASENKLAEHVIKRAYEIGKISRERLMQGYNA
jgi:hypothetical protein